MTMYLPAKGCNHLCATKCRLALKVGIRDFYRVQSVISIHGLSQSRDEPSREDRDKPGSPISTMKLRWLMKLGTHDWLNDAPRPLGNYLRRSSCDSSYHRCSGLTASSWVIEAVSHTIVARARDNLTKEPRISNAARTANMLQRRRQNLNLSTTRLHGSYMK